MKMIMMSLPPSFSFLLLLSLALLLCSGSSRYSIAAAHEEEEEKNDDYYRPVKLPYQHLMVPNNYNNNKDAAATATATAAEESSSSALTLMMGTLQTVGMISITDMPLEYQTAKRDLQALLHGCLLLLGNDSSANTYAFEDGTTRTTLATHTTRGGKAQPLFVSSQQHNNNNDNNGSEEKEDACIRLNDASGTFRHYVNIATRALAERLGEMCENNDDNNKNTMPLLQSLDGSHSLDTLADLVREGEHLEHFHEYQYLDRSDTTTSTSTHKEDNQDQDATTIEWHTDQGLLLAFTPGVLVDHHKKEEERTLLFIGDHQHVDGFYIELDDGSRPMVVFDPDEDDLVFLLGDGMKQIMSSSSSSSSSYCDLRVLPHALSMPRAMSSFTMGSDDEYEKEEEILRHHETTSRIWYGRMVLPPANAMHPQHQQRLDDEGGSTTDTEKITFGALREMLVEESYSTSSSSTHHRQEEIMALGCSGPNTHRARQLEETSCEEGTLLCWHRCMNTAEQNATEAECSAKGLDLACINPRGQLWDNTHGDWYPGCIDVETAPNATPYPKLPNYPRDENEICTADAYLDFVEGNAAKYQYMANLTNGGVLYWSVESSNNDDDDVVNGMISYNGLFGWLAFGFAGPPGGKNEMEGAKVIMAKPSSVYNATHGFDFDFDPSVDEHEIGSETAFRHWQTPISSISRQTGVVVSDASSYAVQEEMDCFTTMTFQTAGIVDQRFNVTGTDYMIWAANGEDIFAGYHGESRGAMTVSWLEGTVALKDYEQTQVDDDSIDNKEPFSAAMGVHSLLVVDLIMAVAATTIAPILVLL